MWIDVVITLMGIAVGAILLLNLFFRVQVMRKYGVLAENKVQLKKSHFVSRAKLEAEVLPRYPQLRQEIITFTNYIRYSIRCNIALVTLITILAATLIFGKNYY